MVLRLLDSKVLLAVFCCFVRRIRTSDPLLVEQGKGKLGFFGLVTTALACFDLPT
jgi:hypothetical protein